MDIEQKIKELGYNSINQFAVEHKKNANTIRYWISNYERLGYNKKKEVHDFFDKQLMLSSVVKSSYCVCDFPIVRTSINMDEYCGDCGKDIKK